MKEFYRTRTSVVVVIIFPVFFLFIFSLAFSGASIYVQTTYQIAIVNHDSGIPNIIKNNATYQQILPQNWLTNGIGDNLSKTILGVHYQSKDGKNEAPVFNNTNYNDNTIPSGIDGGKIVLGIIIPENFSMYILNLINNQNPNHNIQNFPTSINASIGIIGNQNSNDFAVAKSIVISIVSSYTKGIEQGNFVDNLQIDSQYVLPKANITIFDFVAAGIFIFATILSASFIASHAIIDDENETLSRIRLSGVNSTSYIGGILILSLIIIIVQSILLFLSAIWLFNFHPAGSLFQGFIVIILLSFTTLGYAFTIAAFAKKSETAGSAIGFSSSLIGFASGAFFQMPNIILVKGILGFTSGSPDLLLWDLLPWTHAVNAMRAILLFNQSIFDVWGDILLLLIMGVLWFIIGLRLYSTRKFRMEA